MNKAFILLLVTLVQSQSDGVLLSNPNTNDRFQDSQLEDWEVPDSSYGIELIKDYDQNSESNKKRSLTSDSFTRRSTLDKNFMRFGRGGGGDTSPSRCGRRNLDGKLNFYRFGRGLKDSFIRFGRGRDNFVRFGRGGGKDGFIRFGRTRPEDFFRAGKSLRENFIRFGKADKNFMRFGRQNTDEDYQDFFSSEEPFQRLVKSSRAQDNFMRFGKSEKNETNSLRFGKSEAESEEADENSQDSIPKGSKRKRRDIRDESPAKNSKGSTGFFQIPPENFPRRIPPVLVNSGRNLENYNNFKLTPFFPVLSDFPKNPDYYGSDHDKRNQGGSNFIRFG